MHRPLYSPFLCLWGLSDGVFPGVSLLSRRRLSGLPVDLAIGFGPGLIAMITPLVVTEDAANEVFETLLCHLTTANQVLHDGPYASTW
jgi:hypothetical protein